MLLGGGEYEDDFESYPLGEICGQNGWEEWDGSSDVCGSVVDNESFDGFQSLKIVGATGQGIATLTGKTVRQRVDELISVAHPDFKADLQKQAASIHSL